MQIKINNKDFNITPAQATEMAQEIHNDIDLNGELNEPKIVDNLCETFCEVFEEWLIHNIDWQKIEDDDRDLREFVAEREDAARGKY